MTKMEMLAEMWRKTKDKSPEFSRVADWLQFCSEVCAEKGVTLTLRDKNGGLTPENLRLIHPKYNGEAAQSLLNYDLTRHWVRCLARKPRSSWREEEIIRKFRQRIIDHAKRRVLNDSP